MNKNPVVAKKIEDMLEREASKKGHGMLPLWQERGVYNFYLKVGKNGNISTVDNYIDYSKATRAELLKMVRNYEAILAQAPHIASGSQQDPNGSRLATKSP